MSSSLINFLWFKVIFVEQFFYFYFVASDFGTMGMELQDEMESFNVSESEVVHHVREALTAVPSVIILALCSIIFTMKDILLLCIGLDSSFRLLIAFTISLICFGTGL